MNSTIDNTVLNGIVRYQRSLGVVPRLKGMPYERCAELSWVVARLQARFGHRLRYLDIGSGESPLPTYIYRNSQWDVTCLDKCEWVRKQRLFLNGGTEATRHFQVLEEDLLAADLEPESFDVITSISVIEHFQGSSDSEAMRASARLLRPGGEYILTTLINDGHYREFFLERDVYGDRFERRPVFYQRHHDARSLAERIIAPSGLIETERVYFGDYGFQCFEKVLQQPKPLRALYMWATPLLARRYLTYRPYPVSRERMRMNTASGVILVLTKPAKEGAI